MFDPSLVDSLSANSEERVFIRRIAEHKPELTAEDCAGFPANRRAAVLVLLFVRDGHIRVLLTTRSKSLRSHPGQVALPGGRCDPEDGSMVKTAIREAHEEVGLSSVCLSPRHRMGNWSEFLQELKANESEVDEIWDHPLEAVLSPELVHQPDILTVRWPSRARKGGHMREPYDREWMRDTHYRMHRFRTVAVPIKGLTADILIRTAEIVYKRQPSFTLRADDQLDFGASLKYVIEDIEANVAKKAAEQRRLAPA
ncbi:NUDIX domain [Rhizoctonia solani]|uniref:NUDIX domain n=1 Tax=Rhizoctonia solani TaxID=456999 RepID=A0A8H7IAA5_9AGAM|nr:NUDIX domain [Rhizoctonia solani]